MLAWDPGSSGQMKDWEKMPILMINIDHVCVSWRDIRSNLQGMKKQLLTISFLNVLYLNPRQGEQSELHLDLWCSG